MKDNFGIVLKLLEGQTLNSGHKQKILFDCEVVVNTAVLGAQADPLSLFNEINLLCCVVQNKGLRIERHSCLHRKHLEQGGLTSASWPDDAHGLAFLNAKSIPANSLQTAGVDFLDLGCKDGPFALLEGLLVVANIGVHFHFGLHDLDLILVIIPEEILTPLVKGKRNIEIDNRLDHKHADRKTTRELGTPNIWHCNCVFIHHRVKEVRRRHEVRYVKREHRRNQVKH